jgi:hypothetical protein
MLGAEIHEIHSRRLKGVLWDDSLGKSVFGGKAARPIFSKPQSLKKAVQPSTRRKTMKHSNTSKQCTKNVSSFGLAKRNRSATIKREKLKARLFDESSDIIENENILDLLTKTLDSGGLVGEERTVKLLYLCLTTRFLPNLVSAAIKGESSGGKSYVVNEMLRLFPKSAYYVMTSMSDKALIYSEESFKNRFLIIQEIEGVRNEEVDYLIRVLLTDGCIKHEVTGKGPIVKDGPTGLITTTTRISLHPENETRYLLLNIDDSEEQTKRIMAAQAEQAARGRGATTQTDQGRELKRWIAFQRWLKLANHDVIIPYAPAVSELVNPEAIRLRRDFSKLLDLIKAHAIIHQHNRKTDREGRIIAEFKDYGQVAPLLNDVLSVSANVEVSEKVKEIVDAVEELLDGNDSGTVTVTAIAKHLDVNKSTISRGITEAMEKEYLIAPKIKGGRSSQIRLGESLPSEIRILPDVKKVFDMHNKMRKENTN